jgi:hypothetical protein
MNKRILLALMLWSTVLVAQLAAVGITSGTKLTVSIPPSAYPLILPAGRITSPYGFSNTDVLKVIIKKIASTTDATSLAPDKTPIYYGDNVTLILQSDQSRSYQTITTNGYRWPLNSIRDQPCLQRQENGATGFIIKNSKNPTATSQVQDTDLISFLCPIALMRNFSAPNYAQFLRLWKFSNGYSDINANPPSAYVLGSPDTASTVQRSDRKDFNIWEFNITDVTLPQ